MATKAGIALNMADAQYFECLRDRPSKRQAELIAECLAIMLQAELDICDRSRSRGWSVVDTSV